MARPRRPLTEVERAEQCPRCHARPGQRCVNPGGTPYSGIVHAERENAASSHRRRGKFSAEDIHPRTLAEVAAGSAVVIRDAFGKQHQRIAQTGVVRGADFLVIWVTREEEVASAKRDNRDPVAVPWPAEDVWLPGDEPETTKEDGDAG